MATNNKNRSSKWARPELNWRSLPCKGVPYGENREQISKVNKNQLKQYLIKIELSGVERDHLKLVKSFLSKYLKYTNYSIDEKKTLDYLMILKHKSSIAYYRKQSYQIRKFLTYFGMDWARDIKLPPEPVYTPKRITTDNIKDLINHFEKHEYFKQIKALIMLGGSSGMRAEEIYQLDLEDIDLENNIIHINHNPKKNQTTKSKKSRISFFNEETKQSILDYLPLFHEDNRLTCLFSQSHIKGIFRDAPLKVKDLRKWFSQEWTRRGGPSGIKKLLMGHSLRGDVDLMHYNYQSEEDLKRIYDKVDIKIK